MKILIVANHNKGFFVPFIVEQVDALKQLGVEIEYYGVHGKGIRGYGQGHFSAERYPRFIR